MEPDKAKEHNSDDGAKEHDDGEHLILTLQVLKHDAPVGWVSLSLTIHESLIP